MRDLVSCRSLDVPPSCLPPPPAARLASRSVPPSSVSSGRPSDRPPPALNFSGKNSPL